MTTRSRKASADKADAPPATDPKGSGAADEAPTPPQQTDPDTDGTDTGAAPETVAGDPPETAPASAAAPLEPPPVEQPPPAPNSLPPGSPGIAVAAKATHLFEGATPTLYNEAGEQVRLEDVIVKAPPPGLLYRSTSRLYAEHPVPNTNITTRKLLVGEGQIFGAEEYDRLRAGLGLPPGPHHA